jgi:hypothetical protein
LGADGCLPELVFQDQVAEQEPHETNPRESKPLLLIGVLCFSITLSVILLVFEPQKVQSDDAAKAEARRQIATFYLGVGPTLKPYEKRLREALQAYHRHDQDAARRHCREVLDMLHNESHQGAAGLTGMRTAQKAPNDQHLEQQLAILMSRD